MKTLFFDCFDREIKVGDVIASGRRLAAHGDVIIGIVRGFIPEQIVVDTVIRDDRLRGRLGPDGHPIMQRWRLGKTWFNADCNCCITGMTEADLRKVVGLKMEDREDSETIS